ncbi:hypothetical protein A2999_00075 [Candidatus Wolfebacteria bacterium RIFCSPLOWO2_01_FULL_38_11]|uniref:Uncharacterized protein n=2 Tax=Candidatus Wolfeibacteriota TaxID=1752735 RepID=A0A0G0IGR7_9BACT|nr:MAG: hypothetical protein US36_C0001G0013 [Candidatus Wolfebacteria bacterium GW2011_GWC1_37_10]OGM90350.1 MAG: hypothetical protein A2999_00075 [Candidatus Wolfebacteria bacterium RIFCSPLOWO2_01_FULL_38_11]
MAIEESKTITIQAKGKICEECGDKMDEFGNCPSCGFTEEDSSTEKEDDDSSLGGNEEDENY